MRTPARVAAFAAGLAAEAHDKGGHDGQPAHDGADADVEVGGLAVRESGCTLDLLTDVLPAAPATTLAFRVLGPDGAPVREFDVVLEEDLHLVAVRCCPPARSTSSGGCRPRDAWWPWSATA